MIARTPHKTNLGWKSSINNHPKTTKSIQRFLKNTNEIYIYQFFFDRLSSLCLLFELTIFHIVKPM